MTGMIGDTEASSPGSVFYPYQTRWCLGTLQVPITAHLETQGLMTLWVPVQKSMAPMPSAGRTPRRLQEEGASLMHSYCTPGCLCSSRCTPLPSAMKQPGCCGSMPTGTHQPEMVPTDPEGTHHSQQCRRGGG